MDKVYTYEKYEVIASSYFQGEFSKQKPFDEPRSLSLFRQVIKDYLEKKVDIKVVGLIASDLYWYLNDTNVIERHWSNKLAHSLSLCSEAHYYSSRADDGDKEALSKLQGIVDNLKQNWAAELK